LGQRKDLNWTHKLGSVSGFQPFWKSPGQWFS
jgi:hypothetical protein